MAIKSQVERTEDGAVSGLALALRDRTRNGAGRPGGARASQELPTLDQKPVEDG